MNNKRLILLLALSVLPLLSITICDAQEPYGGLPEGIILKNESIPWVSSTTIITPFADKAQMQIIYYVYVPKNSEVTGFGMDCNISVKLSSEIDLYINDQKENFSEYFITEISEGNVRIKPIKVINLTESSTFRIKTFVKSINQLSFDGNRLTYSTDFYFGSNQLFNAIVIRVPLVNAHNLKLQLWMSLLESPGKLPIPAPITEIYETDEYLEVTYRIWNDELAWKIIEAPALTLSLQPNQKYILKMGFSVLYETFRKPWLIAIVWASILAIITFVGGALWGKRQKE